MSNLVRRRLQVCGTTIVTASAHAAVIAMVGSRHKHAGAAQ